MKERTSTYEHPSIAPSVLSGVMFEFWELVHAAKSPIELDHFWMYTDFSTVPGKKKLGVKLKKNTVS
jgi:hypothetical protein